VVGRRVELRDPRITEDLRLQRGGESNGEYGAEEGREAKGATAAAGPRWHYGGVLGNPDPQGNPSGSSGFGMSHAKTVPGPNWRSGREAGRKSEAP
jgi:hypothetical protein